MQLLRLFLASVTVFGSAFAAVSDPAASPYRIQNLAGEDDLAGPVAEERNPALGPSRRSPDEAPPAPAPKAIFTSEPSNAPIVAIFVGCILAGLVAIFKNRRRPPV